MELIQDTYFDNFNDALEIAKQQNRFSAYNCLQICYYDGAEQKTPYKNLINLPQNEIVDRLLFLNTRIPTKVISKSEKNILEQIERFKTLKKELYFKSVMEIKSLNINFEDPLRFYMSIDYGGKVVSNIYKILYDVILNMGFDIYFDENDELTYMDDFKRADSINKFKPHINININRIRNDFLNDDMFNFIWFQDPTLILYDDTIINVRSRDYFFTLVDNFKLALINKNVPCEKIYSQSFCIDSKLFYLEDEIERENKIVFIGNNYFEVGMPTRDYKNKVTLIEELSLAFNSSLLTRQKLEQLALKYLENGTIKSKEHMEMFIFNAMVRVEVLKWICAQNKIKVEIYGEGWDHISEIKPYYKGFLKSKDEIRRVCNSATYSLLAHPEYYYQQRLFEAAACGSIPIVYQGINNSESFFHKDNVLLFNDQQSLFECIGKKPKKQLQEIVKDLNYNKLIQKIIDIVRKNV